MSVINGWTGRDRLDLLEEIVFSLIIASPPRPLPSKKILVLVLIMSAVIIVISGLGF